VCLADVIERLLHREAEHELVDMVIDAGVAR
jgi:hypothetical protein